MEDCHDPLRLIVTARRIIIYCAVLAAVCFRGPARAAQTEADLRDFAVRTWSKAEGLPDASVTVITQTRDGYLWVGTAAGLFRFDGIKFTPAPLAAENTNAAPSITSLCEDSAGRLWIGSQDQGIFCWQNGRARHFGAADGLLDSTVTSMTEDGAGRVWIGTRRGLNRWDGERLLAFTTRDGLPDNSVLSVHAAHSGTIWITTAGGMCRFSGGQLERYHIPTTELEQDQELIQAYEDRRGNLWAFYPTYLINLREGKQRINYFPGEKSAVTRIWSLCEDRMGRLWIGASGRGVFCFDRNRFQPVTLNEGRWPTDVRTICEDREGDLWLGIAGVGLVQLRPQTISMLAEHAGLPPGAATAAALDASGQICVGMDAGGVYRSVGDHFEAVQVGNPFLAQDLVSSLAPDRDGSLWIGTTGTGLYQVKDGRAVVYSTANGLADDCVLSVCVDAAGRVWAGTRSGAVQRVENGHLSIVTLPSTTPAGITALLPARNGGMWAGTAAGDLIHGDTGFQNAALIRLPPKVSGKAILGLCESSHGGLWIGTDGGGLAFVQSRIRSAWDAQDGLPDNVICGMSEDSEGDLWLVTPRGLCRVANGSLDPALAGARPLKVSTFYETDPAAFRSMKLGEPRAVRAPSGRLWFALSSGLVGVDIHGRETEKPAPLVHIESMLVNNKPTAFSTEPPAPVSNTFNFQTTVLPASTRALDFRFTALSFEAPEKVRFRHKLDGFDSDWVTGTERFAHYGPLASGYYEFHVTACNAEGLWNDTAASLNFVIPTPLWRAPWMLALGALMATAVGAGTVRVVSHRRLRHRLRGLEQQQAMERERMRIAQNMHDEIGSKLTKISYLSERAKTELRGVGKAEGKIDSIATTSRDLLKALDEIVWAVNPRNDSLEHLAAYLCQYAREYFQDTAVECDVRVQSRLPHVEMTAELRHNLFLAFEESLNNVLKHAGATRLSVDIAAESDRLRITVRDNGRGFAPGEQNGRASSHAGGGNGLRNMRQRLASAGGQCVIESAHSGGTTVSLRVPLDSAKLRS